MKKIFLVFTLVIGITNIEMINAQNEANVWYFGDHAGIDFYSGTPVALSNGAMLTYDNASAISDSSGNILFYTDGMSVWNRYHQVMANGTGLNGSNNGGQCALIIPRPNTTEYYIFTVGDFGIAPLYYSIVDMSLQAGLGDITTKNAMLYGNATEKLAGFYNCADNSYWLISHKYNSNEFYVYKVNSNGLNLTPVISSAGLIQNAGPTNDVNNSAGQLSISSDGSKLAGALYYTGEIELFDFNTSTGTVSNAQLISNYLHAWGLEFSDDNSKLYLSQWFTSPITQFDLTSGNINVIANSAITIGNATGAGQYNAGYLQRGPDNKIYIARWDVNYIAVINNPNDAGNNCNFINDGVNLGIGVCKAGLCRTVNKDCLASGINESKANESLIVYYDYSNKNIHINNLQGNIRDEIDACVYDSEGRLVLRELFFGKAQHSISTDELSQGLYILKIITGNRIQFLKIIVSE